MLVVGDIREISSCFWQFWLFFCKESGECDDVCVDCLILGLDAIGSHGEEYVGGLDDEE